MDTIRRVLKATQQTDKSRMLVRVEAVEKMLQDYDELKAMMTAFRHAANSLALEAGITKDHVSHEVAEASVCQKDGYYLDLIRGAEQRMGLERISFEHQTTLLNSCEKALVERDKKIESMDLKMKDGFRHEERLGDRVQELKLQRFARFDDQECWVYTGEDDDLESLTCPVVIDPKTLIKLIQEALSNG
jgi:flagellar capping protein FliD